MESLQILLLALYGISCLLALEIIAIFTRVRKNLTLRVFSAVYAVFACTIFVPIAITKGKIAELDSQACRAQSLLMLYLLSLMYVLSFFLTFNVWSAVCTRKFRDQETRRFPLYLITSIIFALIPTVIVGVLNSKEKVGMGFGPHNVYCSYKFPIMSYAYGPLWYNSLWLLLTFGMIVHAAARLLKYRSILSAAAKGASSSGQNNSKRGGTGGSGNKRNSSSANNSGSGTISLTMCYRFGVWGMIYLLIIGLANYRQTRAVFAGKYERSDMNLGVREFSGAVVGLAIWIIFGTGRAAWHASTIYVIYQRFKPAPRSVFNDGYDLRTYYNMPESGAAGSNSITNPQKPLGGVAVPSQAATSYRNDHPRNNPAVADPYRGYQGQGYQGQQQQQQQAQQQDYQDYKQQYGRGYTSRDDYDQGYSNGQAPYRY